MEFKNLSRLLLILISIISAQGQLFDFFSGLQTFIQPHTTNRPTDITTKHVYKHGPHNSAQTYKITNTSPFITSTTKPAKTTRRPDNNDARISYPNSVNKNTTKYLTSTNYNYDRESTNNYRISNDNHKSNSRITVESITRDYTYNNNNQDYRISDNSNKETSRINNNNKRTNQRNPNVSGLDPITIKPTTVNSLLHRPGVKPAPVDHSRPAITNRPPSIPSDSVSHVDLNVSTGIELGPDEDNMTEGEKRRHVEIGERMCDKYKAMTTKRIEAIPLLPSPRPIRVNVSDCVPITIPLVVGGKAVSINEYPHMGLVGWRKVQLPGYSWKCGSSLLSERYSLTAGHCSYQEKDDSISIGTPKAVQLGSTYLDDPSATVVRISSVIRHPKYKQQRSYYDVAILKLASTVIFSEVIRPACLGSVPRAGQRIIATGWGRTEHGNDQSKELRSVSLPVWDMWDCSRVLGTSRKLPKGPLPGVQMCAGDPKGGRDTCQGDSGGPAQIQDGCVWRVVGITSLGRSCGAANTPGLYAVAPKAFISAVVFSDVTTRPATQGTQNSNFNRPTQTYDFNRGQDNIRDSDRFNNNNNNGGNNNWSNFNSNNRPAQNNNFNTGFNNNNNNQNNNNNNNWANFDANNKRPQQNNNFNTGFNNNNNNQNNNYNNNWQTQNPDRINNQQNNNNNNKKYQNNNNNNDRIVFDADNYNVPTRKPSPVLMEKPWWLG